MITNQRSATAVNIAARLDARLWIGCESRGGTTDSDDLGYLSLTGPPRRSRGRRPWHAGHLDRPVFRRPDPRVIDLMPSVPAVNAWDGKPRLASVMIVGE